METVTDSSSQRERGVTFRDANEAIAALADLDNTFNFIVDRMRQVSAPPSGRERHIVPLKAAEVASFLGISVTLLNERVRELEGK